MDWDAAVIAVANSQAGQVVSLKTCQVIRCPQDDPAWWNVNLLQKQWVENYGLHIEAMLAHALFIVYLQKVCLHFYSPGTREFWYSFLDKRSVGSVALLRRWGHSTDKSEQYELEMLPFINYFYKFSCKYSEMVRKFDFSNFRDFRLSSFAV